jgi:hypothetical protein
MRCTSEASGQAVAVARHRHTAGSPIGSASGPADRLGWDRAVSCETVARDPKSRTPNQAPDLKPRAAQPVRACGRVSRSRGYFTGFGLRRRTCLVSPTPPQAWRHRKKGSVDVALLTGNVSLTYEKTAYESTPNHVIGRLPALCRCRSLQAAWRGHHPVLYRRCRQFEWGRRGRLLQRAGGCGHSDQPGQLHGFQLDGAYVHSFDGCGHSCSAEAGRPIGAPGFGPHARFWLFELYPGGGDEHSGSSGQYGHQPAPIRIRTGPVLV